MRRRPETSKFFAPLRARRSTGSMSVEVERATLPCGVCGAAVTELRRGRCWGCYTRWAESRPVGRGASCIVCGEKRRAQLKLVELHGRSLPFCHGCAAQVMRLPEVPDRRGAPPCAPPRPPRTTTDGAARSTSASSRASGGWASGAAPSRDAFADTDPRIKIADLHLDDAIIELSDADLAGGDQTPGPAPQPLARPPRRRSASSALIRIAVARPSSSSPRARRGPAGAHRVAE